MTQKWQIRMIENAQRSAHWAAVFKTMGLADDAYHAAKMSARWYWRAFPNQQEPRA